MAARIGNYEIIEKLGQGGMGAVFKAKQLSMERVVALKVLPPKLAKDDQFVQRFLREAKATGQLAHPNLVNAIEVGKAGEFYFFSMEFVDGPNAKQLLDQKGRLSEEQVIGILIDTAKALHCAWQRLHPSRRQA